MKLTVSFLNKTFVCAVACLVLGAALVTIPVRILQLESGRSLGDGMLASALQSKDEKIAVRAALAIGRTKQPAGISLLRAHLTDGRDAVRAMSIYGLGVIALGTDPAVIARAARSDRSGAARVAALDALGRYEAAGRLKAGEPQAEAAVAAALANDTDPIVRGRAAITLNLFAAGPAGHAAASALVHAMAVERENSVRERAMWSIFRRYASAVPRSVLDAALRDHDEVVRIEAVRAFGHLSGPAAAEAVRPLLADPSWRVQEQAAESLLALEGKDLTQHFAAIPSTVHTPAPQPDRLASLPAIDAETDAKPAPPSPDEATFDPQLDPRTAAAMTGPAPGPHPRVRIVTTKGNLYVVLYPEWAPLTTLNFLNLARNGFFSNNRWFRIVPDFVVQTGEQDDVKQPGPGYTIGAEENPLEQNSYVISMGLNYDSKSNTPIRDSAGSEYYVTLSPQYHLDNDFTVFGTVTSGFDVLGRLVESDKVVRIERIADVTL